MAKRNRIETVFDILKVVKEKHGTIRVSHILTKANLSYNNLRTYLPDLISQGLIEELVDKNLKTYSITEKGEDYYQKLKQMKTFIDSFEI